MGHIEEHLDKTPVEYLQWRFNGAVDREALSLTVTDRCKLAGVAIRNIDKRRHSAHGKMAG